jgi:hypothetical protein
VWNGLWRLLATQITPIVYSSPNVLVWSFYEKPEADTFLRECNDLFLGEEEGTAGGRLERLQRGVRDGRQRLIVLDGLERVQEDAGSGGVHGQLSNQPVPHQTRGDFMGCDTLSRCDNVFYSCVSPLETTAGFA